ncbi:MAG: hypothetical protein Tsb0034_15330 [Ekhidna sp.]
MIKSIFLNHKSKSLTEIREHCTYLEAQNIGVLFNADDFSDELVDELIDSLTGDGKIVSKLGFVDRPAELNLHFSKKDISGTGSIKKESVEAFVRQPFDFLISLDTSEDINFRYVLALSKARCKVGFEAETYTDLLQLSIRPEEEKSVSIRNVMKYLKMI